MSARTGAIILRGSPQKASASGMTVYFSVTLPARPEFQAFQSGSNADADLALHAERLQRDRIGGAADQHIAADADAERGAALRADIIAGEVARTEPCYRREHTPRQCGFRGDA